jgi:hypothetical protein
MAGAYDKSYHSNIKLINSIIKDDNGYQISITKDERLGIVHATGGPTTQANPLITQAGLDTALGNYQAGVSWRPPVKSFVELYNTLVSATAPVSPDDGDTYVKTTDAKLYTYVTDTWNAGVQLDNGVKVLDTATDKIFTVVTGALNGGTAAVFGDRFLNSEDNKVYEYTTEWTALTPAANWVVSTLDTDKTYMYDLETTTWGEQPNMNSVPKATTGTYGKVKIGTNVDVSDGVISVATATTSLLGLAELATDGEVAANVVVQGNDSRLLKGRFHNTYIDVTNFEVPHNLASSKLLVQVWCGGEQIEYYVKKKVGSETTVLQIGLNSQLTVEVCVIAIP